MAYAIHYDEGSGTILSIADSVYASSGDWIVQNFPPNFTIDSYYIYQADRENDTIVRYFVNNDTGYAYNYLGIRVYTNAEEAGAIDDGSGMTIQPRSPYDDLLPPPSQLVRSSQSEPEDISVTLEDRSFALTPDGAYVLNASGSGIDNTIDAEAAEASIDAAMGRISAEGVFCEIILTPDWAWDGEYWLLAVANENITRNTLMHVVGFDREKLQSDIVWTGDDGKFVFRTSGGGPSNPPVESIRIFCLLKSTADNWASSGILDAWPAKDLVSKRYRHSLHAATDSVMIGQDEASVQSSFPIPAGGTANIQTTLDFSSATLLFATPEWTGNTHVIMPHCYVNSNDHLCYTLTNLSQNQVVVSEVMIRLMYRGHVDNLITDEEDEATLTGYITNEDIDEVVG